MHATRFLYRRNTRQDLHISVHTLKPFSFPGGIWCRGLLISVNTQTHISFSLLREYDAKVTLFLSTHTSRFLCLGIERQGWLIFVCIHLFILIITKFLFLIDLFWFTSLFFLSFHLRVLFSSYPFFYFFHSRFPFLFSYFLLLTHSFPHSITYFCFLCFYFHLLIQPFALFIIHFFLTLLLYRLLISYLSIPSIYSSHPSFLFILFLTPTYSPFHSLHHSFLSHSFSFPST